MSEESHEPAGQTTNSNMPSADTSRPQTTREIQEAGFPRCSHEQGDFRPFILIPDADLQFQRCQKLYFGCDSRTAVDIFTGTELRVDGDKMFWASPADTGVAMYFAKDRASKRNRDTGRDANADDAFRPAAVAITLDPRIYGYLKKNKMLVEGKFGENDKIELRDRPEITMYNRGGQTAEYLNKGLIKMEVLLGRHNEKLFRLTKHSRRYDRHRQSYYEFTADHIEIANTRNRNGHRY